MHVDKSPHRRCRRSVSSRLLSAELHARDRTPTYARTQPRITTPAVFIHFSRKSKSVGMWERKACKWKLCMKFLKIWENFPSGPPTHHRSRVGWVNQKTTAAGIRRDWRNVKKIHRLLCPWRMQFVHLILTQCSIEFVYISVFPHRALCSVCVRVWGLSWLPH